MKKAIRQREDETSRRTSLRVDSDTGVELKEETAKLAAYEPEDKR